MSRFLPRVTTQPLSCSPPWNANAFHGWSWPPHGGLRRGCLHRLRNRSNRQAGTAGRNRPARRRLGSPKPGSGRGPSPGHGHRGRAPGFANVYAASKVSQEHLDAAWARSPGGAAIALRYYNVYGPRMPRDKPYAGVASLFRPALARAEAPRVFEDTPSAAASSTSRPSPRRTSLPPRHCPRAAVPASVPTTSVPPRCARSAMLPRRSVTSARDRPRS